MEDLQGLEKEQGLCPGMIFFHRRSGIREHQGRTRMEPEDQYEGAGKFLESVRTAFKREVPGSRVFIVPGNHDVDRKWSPEALPCCSTVSNPRMMSFP